MPLQCCFGAVLFDWVSRNVAEGYDGQTLTLSRLLPTICISYKIDITSWWCIALTAEIQYEAAGRSEISSLPSAIFCWDSYALSAPCCVNKANPHTGSAHSTMHSKICLTPKHFCYVLR